MSDYRSYTDNELAILLRQDDRDAFAEIYRRYWGLLLTHGLSILKEEDPAKDVVQDVFEMLWEKRRMLEIHTSLSAFLYTSIRHRILKLLRHLKVVERYLFTLQDVLDQGMPSADAQMQEKELARIIEEGLDLLPPRMREVFVLSRKQEYSYREIAEELEISDHTVKRQVSNALKILRVKLNRLTSFFL